MLRKLNSQGTFDAQKINVVVLEHSGCLRHNNFNMLAEKELSESGIDKHTVLTIGVFDGVHLGHKHLLSRLKQESHKHSALSCVITFKRHPVESLHPDAALPYLTSLDAKIALLKAEGIDIVVPLTFDRSLASLSARDFIGRLQHHLKMCALVVGPDFALGRNREGNVTTLTRLGREIGFSVTVVPPLKLDGEVISSTAIRQALADGDMGKVVKLTGRPYSLRGRVTTGRGLGRQLGFPTANLQIEPGWAIPADGVYATFTHIDDHIYQSLTSIGLRPTFSGKNRTVETYIMDYQGELYGRDIAIDVVEKLRPEKKFADVEELKNQISKDIVSGKEILDRKSDLIFGRYKD